MLGVPAKPGFGSDSRLGVKLSQLNFFFPLVFPLMNGTNWLRTLVGGDERAGCYSVRERWGFEHKRWLDCIQTDVGAHSAELWVLYTVESIILSRQIKGETALTLWSPSPAENENTLDHVTIIPVGWIMVCICDQLEWECMFSIQCGAGLYVHHTGLFFDLERKQMLVTVNVNASYFTQLYTTIHKLCIAVFFPK